MNAETVTKTLEMLPLRWEPLRKIAAAQKKLLTERAEVEDRVAELKKIADELIKPFATSLRGGTDYSAGPKVRELNEELVGLLRRLEAVDLAQRENAAELTTVLEKNRVRWAGDVRKSLDKAAADFLAAIEKLDAARSAVQEERAVLAWLDGSGQDRSQRHKDAILHGIQRGSRNQGFTPIRWAEIAELLRKEGATLADAAGGQEPPAEGSEAREKHAGGEAVGF